ncbi:hypothetical protein C1645_793090 [Glomus cerebriforme]|uniref:Uncharacterized protein n=1 Tax=Glomus cerebriforme TaxID=658196 RepID=A0A397S3W4_9GLOM|nr:hypothetical protein C1645_793090 [Glomus cerebriforme]
MKIGTDTNFPENLTIPEILKVPDGNVFKFVLFGIGVIDYKFNASDSTWIVSNGESFYFNDPKDISFDPNSIVATLLGGSVDQSGKDLKGVVKSAIPGDNSLIANKTIAVDFHPKLKTIRGTLGQVETHEGTSFSDITYIQSIFSGKEQDPPAGSHPDGYICRIPTATTHLYYKSQ